MARTAMTAVENLGPFDLPTATAGDNIYNSGDGVYFIEHPGQPATIGLLNLSGASATVTVSVNPGAPGSPATEVLTISANGYGLVIPPGFLPSLLFRRGDEQGTNPGTIYLDASADNVFGCVVRGPAGYRSKRGNPSGPAISGNRTLVTPQNVAPRSSISIATLLADTDGLGFYPKGDEAMYFKCNTTQTLTLTVNPNNPFGRTSDLTVQSDANEMIVFPPGVPHPDLVVREHATNPGMIYFSSNQAAATMYCIVGLSKRQP